MHHPVCVCVHAHVFVRYWSKSYVRICVKNFFFLAVFHQGFLSFAYPQLEEDWVTAVREEGWEGGEREDVGGMVGVGVEEGGRWSKIINNIHQRSPFITWHSSQKVNTLCRGEWHTLANDGFFSLSLFVNHQPLSVFHHRRCSANYQTPALRKL